MDIHSTAQTQQAVTAASVSAARDVEAAKATMRLQRHDALFLRLANLSNEQRAAVIARAQATVMQWQTRQLCSAAYIEGWQKALALPLPQLQAFALSTDDDWGNAFRANSPFLQDLGDAS